MQQAQTDILDVTPENFQSIVERSREVPAIILFWAEQMPPSTQARRDLEALVRQFQGKFLLGLVDVARDPTLAQHLRVQTLPSIRVVQDGQLVHQLDGPQPEPALRALVEQLTMSPAEALQEDLESLIEAGDYQRALQILTQAVQEEPHNQAFRVELADLQIRMGELDRARATLAAIPPDTENRDRPQTRLEFIEEAAGMESLAELDERHAADPNDLETRYRLAVQLAVAGDYPSALDHAMAILQADREFRDDIGRLTMIRIFTLLGKGNELALRYRRRMFAFMH